MTTYGLTRALLALSLAGVAAAADAPSELGKIMFVGDSITHGYGAPSYRWPMHKILVDNGISFSVVGVTQGNQNPSKGIAAGTKYAGAEFNNRHSAMSSERAYEIAGRINKSGRLGNSSIQGWLGLDDTYSGPFQIDTASEIPDVFIMLIGTNDTLSDYGKKGGIGAADNMKEVQLNLLGKRSGRRWNGKGDMDAIVDAMRQANPKARIVLLTVPSWYDERPDNALKEDFAAIADYNKSLKSWAHWKKVELVNINEGLVDVSRTDKPGAGVKDLFNASDKLHPTPQGDLVIAALVARGMGLAGRTAGLERKAAADMGDMPEPSSQKGVAPGKNGKIAIAPKGEISYKWPSDASAGFTVSIQGKVGDGSKGGWSTENGLSVTAGNGSQSGTLQVSEAFISWDGSTLYSGDMSANKEEVRLVWQPGKPAEGIAPGFYVWLGDKLIGEGLAAAGGTGAQEGLVLRNTDKKPLNLLLSATPAPYAPPVAAPSKGKKK